MFRIRLPLEGMDVLSAFILGNLLGLLSLQRDRSKQRHCKNSTGVRSEEFGDRQTQTQISTLACSLTDLEQVTEPRDVQFLRR